LNSNSGLAQFHILAAQYWQELIFQDLMARILINGSISVISFFFFLIDHTPSGAIGYITFRRLCSSMADYLGQI